MQKERKSKSIYKKQQIIIILVLALCFITLVSAFGRYVLNGINNFFVRTKEFYFYSDKLKENSPIYPAIAEFGEIEVEPLRLRFVRGYKE